MKSLFAVGPRQTGSYGLALLNCHPEATPNSTGRDGAAPGIEAQTGYHYLAGKFLPSLPGQRRHIRHKDKIFMFEALTRLFSKPEPEIPDHDPKLAVAALLVHLAAVDGQASEAERAMIRGVLMDTYDLDEAAVDTLVREATARDAEAVDLYRFTSALSALDLEERLEIVRMMWQVVFTDATNHELEDNMVWRVAELIGVSSRDRTVLRSQMARGKRA